MTTTKSYDLLNRLTNIANVPSADAPVSFAYQYNNANQRTKRTEADSSTWNYEYDALGQVTSGKKKWSDNTLVAGQQFEYAYDDIGNRKNTRSGGDSLRLASYSANHLNQYTSRTVPGYLDILGEATNTATVTVNALSSSRKTNYYRTELPIANTTSAVWQPITNVAVLAAGTNDMVTNWTGNLFLPKTPEAFGYDLDGNTTNDGRWLFTWDGENRLISMQSLPGAPAGSSNRLFFSYDAQGRRAGKITQVFTNGLWTTTLITYFVYDGWNLVAEVTSTKAVRNSYVWGLDLSGSIQGAGGVGGLLAITATNAGTHFVSYDGNGNVTALVSASGGSTTGNYEYDPFGNALRATGPLASANPYRFSTKYNDHESSFNYYGYRSYNASNGRWLNRDPLQEGGGLNVYVFAGNNPVDFFDLLGLRWKVDRDGNEKASAKPESGDTVADLAGLIGLSAADYRNWLTPVGPTRMPRSSSEPITQCAEFRIPNTVVAYWAGDLGWLGRWYVRWNSSIRYLERRGFNVAEFRHQNGDAMRLEQELLASAAAKKLHGLYFWGHGTAPYPSDALSTRKDYLLIYANFHPAYKMALGLVFACDSNNGQSALMSGASGSIWKGFSGTLYPLPFRQYHPRHWVHPGDQETR